MVRTKRFGAKKAIDAKRNPPAKRDEQTINSIVCGIDCRKKVDEKDVARCDRNIAESRKTKAIQSESEKIIITATALDYAQSRKGYTLLTCQNE